MKHDLETDFELNIASIVDCLTVLITYLLASATFLTLGVLVVTVPTFDTGDTQVTDKPTLAITVQLLPGHQIRVITEGERSSSKMIPSAQNKQDYDTLIDYLKSLKEKNGTVESAVVAATDSLQYKEIVKTVEKTRQVFPHIAVSTEEITSSL